MPRAESIDEAAFVHTSVFTQPVWSWPEELAARIPSFDELFIDGRPVEGLGDPLRRMRDYLERSLGPVKLLLTGQKGSGKSWALKRLAEQLRGKFTVVNVSATDSAGVTLPDADVQDLLLLLASSLAVECWPGETRMREGVQVDKDTAAKLGRWVTLLSDAGIPSVPARVEGWTAELTAWVVKLATRMRSDEALRAKLREVPAEDMAEVARAMLAVLRGRGRDVVVLFDDVDKLDLASAKQVFLSQSTVLATLNCRMVLTYPFSLNLDGVGRHGIAMQSEVLRNVKVTRPDGPGVPDQALKYFRDLLGKVMNPALVDDDALELAVRLSAGLPREFGLLLQKACLHAYYADLLRIDVHAIEAAERELRIDMIRASQTEATRTALLAIRRDRRLARDEDRRFLDMNLVVEHVNGTAWYDVHPILADTVDEWLKKTP